MTFDNFWWSTVLALVLWAVLTFCICVRVRSGKVAKGSNAARQNILFGLMLVFVSVIPPIFSWNKLNEFKAYQDWETQQTQDNTDKSNAHAHEKKCANAVLNNQPCAPLKEAPDLRLINQLLYQPLEKFVDVIGLVLGLLGGALGVNILTDGLLRKDSQPLRIARREYKTTRTIGFSKWQITQITTKSCAPQDDNGQTPSAT